MVNGLSQHNDYAHIDALLCFVVTRHLQFYSISWWVLHWQSYYCPSVCEGTMKNIDISASSESPWTNDITTTVRSTATPCAYWTYCLCVNFSFIVDCLPTENRHLSNVCLPSGTSVAVWICSNYLFINKLSFQAVLSITYPFRFVATIYDDVKCMASNIEDIKYCKVWFLMKIIHICLPVVYICIRQLSMSRPTPKST